jgi:hypothetical protein
VGAVWADSGAVVLWVSSGFRLGSGVGAWGDAEGLPVGLSHSPSQPPNQKGRLKKSPKRKKD